MYDRIPVPTDGSTGSAHIAMQAIDLAEQYDATVHVVYVVDEDVGSLLQSMKITEPELREYGQRAVEKVERMVQAHGVDVAAEVLEGDPATTILDYADEIDADLVVAGTHGRSGIERRLIGSVAERLVRRASCPVMTVRLPETNVTVEDEDHATELAEEELANRGIDGTVTGIEQQQHVWVAEATTDDGSLLVYVDPETQRTSVVTEANP
jgi:nucleotide-binding universal stress UspA family protein